MENLGHDLTGKVVMHSCDNPPCCNPAHLSVGTIADNVADMVAKGRQNAPRGERHRDAKLNSELVRYIRTTTEPVRSIAKRLGVHRATIYNVKNGSTWTEVQ